MRWNWFVLLSMLLSLSSKNCFGDESVTLRVLCYNIHHAEGVDRSLDVSRIARVIQSVNPDLVALQEVDNQVARTGNVDQSKELAKLTGMKSVFGGNIALQGGEYGNALLTKLPIVKSQNHLLPNIDAGEQRGILEVELRLPNQASPLLFFVTHFDHRRDDRERTESAKIAKRLVEGRLEIPAILAGDLNAVPASEPLRIIREAWLQANKTPAPTVPVDTPTRQIDFIFVRPAERWHVKDFKVIEEAIASDHRAIFAELELR